MDTSCRHVARGCYCRPLLNQGKGIDRARRGTREQQHQVGKRPCDDLLSANATVWRERGCGEVLTASCAVGQRLLYLSRRSDRLQDECTGTTRPGAHSAADPSGGAIEPVIRRPQIRRGDAVLQRRRRRLSLSARPHPPPRRLALGSHEHGGIEIDDDVIRGEVQASVRARVRHTRDSSADETPLGAAVNVGLGGGRRWCGESDVRLRHDGEQRLGPARACGDAAHGGVRALMCRVQRSGEGPAQPPSRMMRRPRNAQ